MDYYVYQYSDPRNDRIFYIGKGKGSRAFQHLKKVRKYGECHNKHFSNLIKNILSDEMEPKIEIIQKDMDEDDALILEETLIRDYGRKGIDENGILCNVLIGGKRGPEGLSEEHRRKISRARTGAKMDQLTRDNISKAKVGKGNSISHNANVSASIKNKFENDEDFKKRHKISRNDPLKNRSKIWIIEDLINKNLFEILDLNGWCKSKNFNKNDKQQLYRTLNKSDKIINNSYNSAGFRLLSRDTLN